MSCRAWPGQQVRLLGACCSLAPFCLSARQSTPALVLVAYPGRQVAWLGIGTKGIGLSLSGRTAAPSSATPSSNLHAPVALQAG